jgi:hypothetical protein
VVIAVNRVWIARYDSIATAEAATVAAATAPNAMNSFPRMPRFPLR